LRFCVLLQGKSLVSIEKQYRNVRIRDKNPIALSLGIQTPKFEYQFSKTSR
jgi:hypothetical protein